MPITCTKTHRHVWPRNILQKWRTTVWLLELLYKNTYQQWLSTHNHLFSITDCDSTLRFHFISSTYSGITQIQIQSTRTKTNRHVWLQKGLWKWRTMTNTQVHLWFGRLICHTRSLLDSGCPDTQPPLLCHGMRLSNQKVL
jgi:hypothetical protein